MVKLSCIEVAQLMLMWIMTVMIYDQGHCSYREDPLFGEFVCHFWLMALTAVQHLAKDQGHVVEVLCRAVFFNQGFSNAGLRPQIGSLGIFLRVATELWGRGVARILYNESSLEYYMFCTAEIV